MPKDPNEVLKKFQKDVEGLADAAHKVLLSWDKLHQTDTDLSGDVARDYPFHVSFDELVGDIHQWKLTLKDMVKKGWPGPREWLPPNPKE